MWPLWFNMTFNTGLTWHSFPSEIYYFSCGEFVVLFSLKTASAETCRKIFLYCMYPWDNGCFLMDVSWSSSVLSMNPQSTFTLDSPQDARSTNWTLINEIYTGWVIQYMNVNMWNLLFCVSLCMCFVLKIISQMNTEWIHVTPAEHEES